MNISGGTVGNGSNVSSSEANISGGTVGNAFQALFGSEVSINGGTVGDNFNVGFNSVLNISGGTVGDGIFVDPNSEVNIFGSEFQLDSLELDTLLPGEAFTINDRDVTLSGLLADGEQFSYELNSVNQFFNGEDFFSPGATLTVTLTDPVPEPSSSAFIAMVLAIGFARRRRG